MIKIVPPSVPEIKEVVDRGGVAHIEGFLSSDEVAELRASAIRLSTTVSPVNIGHGFKYQPKGPDFHHREDPQWRWRDRVRAKLSGRHLRYRRLDSHKFMLWNTHEPAVDHAIELIVRLRNDLYGAHPDFAIDLDRGFFSVATVQHYRQGGDYLSRHSDADFHLRQGLVTRYEIIALLSEQGHDYEDGGLFVDGHPGIVDIGLKAGDVVIYDVRRSHGCKPIDPHSKNPKENKGRWIMLVPPYSIERWMSMESPAR